MHQTATFRKDKNMRQTDIMVEADVEMMLKNGKVERFRLADIPCTWIWDDMSREAAEYWAALDHVSDNYKYDWMSIKSWVGSPVKENKEG
jgi:predicted RNA-binding Zn ribbon-like protein